MTETEIFDLVKRHIVNVLLDVDAAAITPERSLTELGANSVDRVEISLGALEELGLNIPRVELNGVRDIGGLVRVLHRHRQAGA
jgi:polyketide biosynthesis acyl carrier protein